MKWTARELARTLSGHVFNHKHLVVVPDCHWPGSECDLLVVRRDLRLIDVEIKISRADLKRDAAKDKWFEIPLMWRSGSERPRVPRTHPARIWKHYFAAPAEIWTDALLHDIPVCSGVLVIRGRKEENRPLMTIRRQARPNRQAVPITAGEICDIARLQSLRMWDAYDEVDRHRRSLEGSEIRQESVQSTATSDDDARRNISLLMERAQG
jgi:hypothetical protein